MHFAGFCTGWIWREILVERMAPATVVPDQILPTERISTGCAFCPRGVTFGLGAWWYTGVNSSYSMLVFNRLDFMEFITNSDANKMTTVCLSSCPTDVGYGSAPSMPCTQLFPQYKLKTVLLTNFAYLSKPLYQHPRCNSSFHPRLLLS